MSALRPRTPLGLTPGTRVALLATLWLALTTPSVDAAKSKLAALDERWQWVTSSRYEILTNGSERRAKDAIEQLEAFRAALLQMTGAPLADPAEPIRILLFDRIWQMTPYQPLDPAGKPAEWSGYFLTRDDRHWFAMTNEWDEEVPQSALTGYAHVLIWKQVSQLPTWMRVGLAEYFSAFRYKTKERIAEIGRPAGDHLRYLNRNVFVPLERILGTTYDSPEFAREVPRRIFYAKSWLTVHYLQLGAPSQGGSLSRYASHRAQGASDRAAMEQATGLTLEALDEELSVYQRKSLLPYQSVRLASDPLDIAIEVRPATREEAIYRLGEYLLALAPERKSEIEAHFTAAGRPVPAPELRVSSIPLPALSPPATAAAPAPPAPPDPRTIEELHAAIVAGGTGPTEALLLAARVREQSTRDWESTKPFLAVARRALRETLAAALHTEGEWQQLNWLYAAEPDPTDRAAGYDLYERALARHAGVSWLPASFAQFALDGSDFERARAIAEAEIARDPNGAARRRLESTLIELDAQAATSLREAGRGPEGRAILVRRLEATTDPRDRTFAERNLAGFDAALAADAVEAQYRAAVALVNAQKVEAGGDALWKFIQEHPDSLFVELAKRDLEKVDAYLAKKRGYRPRILAPSPPPAPPPPS